jgi:hypothetical protein
MKEIKLSSKLKISADKRQWIIYERFGEHWKAQQFFSNIESLVLGVMEYKLRKKQAIAIQELKKEIISFKKWVLESDFIQQAKSIKNDM